MRSIVLGPPNRRYAAAYVRKAPYLVPRVVWFVCMCVIPDVCGNPLAKHQFATVGSSAIHWDEDQAMSISGVPIFIKHFSTAQTLSGTGQILASHAGFFQHVLTAPGVLILSGVKAGWHWLAEIETSATGSEGRVSALQISADTGLKDANMRHVSSGVLSYAPTSSSQSRNADGRKIIQETYKLDMPKYKFLKSTEIWLRDQGWILASDLPGLQGHSSWRRDSSVLSLFAHSVGDSTLLYVHVVK